MDALNTWVGTGLRRARVLDVAADAVRVLPDDSTESVSCDVLRTASGMPLLLPGDRVLLWAAEDDDRGIVLGLIEAPNREMEKEVDPARPLEKAPDPAADPDKVPDSIVIEARESLTLRVGEGSITLRGDGKVVIRGRDLVSRATRTNRIKGGSVAIN